MNEKEFVVENSQCMKALGKILGEELLQTANNNKSALVLALQGDLGAGKTTFVQGLAKGLGIKNRIASPSFLIMKNWTITSKYFNNFYHLDCYRLSGVKDLNVLGIKDILADKKNMVAIEWAEKVKSILPKQSIWLEFLYQKDNKRLLKIF